MSGTRRTLRSAEGTSRKKKEGDDLRFSMELNLSDALRQMADFFKLRTSKYTQIENIKTASHPRDRRPMSCIEHNGLTKG